MSHRCKVYLGVFAHRCIFTPVALASRCKGYLAVFAHRCKVYLGVLFVLVVFVGWYAWLWCGMDVGCVRSW